MSLEVEGCYLAHLRPASPASGQGYDEDGTGVLATT